MKYLQLQPESQLPNISEMGPFRAVVIVEECVTKKWQELISDWLVDSGCLYMMAWGKDCSSWDDSVDNANMKLNDYRDIPDEKFVMTTWHDNEPLKEAFWFSKYCAVHPAVKIDNILLFRLLTKSPLLRGDFL